MTAYDFVRSIQSDWRVMLWGTAAGIGVFLLFGLVTGLISNPLSARMVPRTPVDYLYLTLIALLTGVYAAQRLVTEVVETGLEVDDEDEADGASSEDRWALGGLVSGFLADGCPICNAFLLGPVQFIRAHDVLLAADHGSKTAKTHNEECDASFATIYRRVSVLQDHDLIEKRNTVDPDGSHRNKFEMALEEFHIEITDGTFSLTLETRDMLADDYTSFWTDRRGDD